MASGAPAMNLLTFRSFWPAADAFAVLLASASFVYRMPIMLVPKVSVKRNLSTSAKETSKLLGPLFMMTDLSVMTR